jgi:hypothetical protein
MQIEEWSLYYEIDRAGFDEVLDVLVFLQKLKFISRDNWVPRLRVYLDCLNACAFVFHGGPGLFVRMLGRRI